MKFPLGRVWRVKRTDLWQWAFYNVLIGLLPVLLSFIALAIAGVFRLLAPFTDGSLLIFAATLSAASMGFFWEETKLQLRETERFIFSGLLVTVLLGSVAYAALIAYREVSPDKLHFLTLGLISLIAFLLACYFNFCLAAVRQAYTDPDLLKTIITEEPSRMAQKAQSEKQVDGIKL